MNRVISPLMVAVVAIGCPGRSLAREMAPLPVSAHNLLVDAGVSCNLMSYDRGRRGAAEDLIYDLQRNRFVKQSQWHEFGVGFGAPLGVVPEDTPAFWMAEWNAPVKANLIVLSGAYPNQPQPETCWKIELRRDGRWTTHARGKGGWYDHGRYVWGGPGATPLEFDAFRVSLFSKDDKTPLESIHFRGEQGVSWIVARLAPVDAAIVPPGSPIRAGQEARFGGRALAGEIRTWQWDFGDGQTARGREVTHTFADPGPHEIALAFSDGKETATVRTKVAVASPIDVRIVPLTAPVIVGQPVQFKGQTPSGKATSWQWDFGDGQTATGDVVRHAYAVQGIYRVKLTASDGRYRDDCLAIVRAHAPQTLHVPQVLLDTDQKNEQDDQHYFGYALFSQLDLLGVNSVHHGGGQEPINYGEILHVLDLARKSGLREDRVPFVFRGANERLQVPPSGQWEDTRPIATAASQAVLAAARGASPSNPVWVVPVGPGTNVASAILQARAEGLELKDRMRVMWLGGSNTAVTGEFNGNNDPWSMYVVSQSGLETWIMPAPVGARVAIDKRTEGDLYADHPLGRYLKSIVPAHKKALYDPSCLSAIIGMRLGLGWVKEVEPVTVAREQGHRWAKTDRPTPVRVIRQIDQQAMQLDIFDTMKGRSTRLVGAAARP